MWVGRYRLSKEGICTICMFLYYRVNQAWEIFFFTFFSDILPFYQPFEKSYFCIIGQNSKKVWMYPKIFFLLIWKWITKNIYEQIYNNIFQNISLNKYFKKKKTIFTQNLKNRTNKTGQLFWLGRRASPSSICMGIS